MTAPWSLGEPLDRDQLHDAAAEYTSHHYADAIVGIAELHVEHVIGELMGRIEDAPTVLSPERRAERMAAVQHLQDRLDEMRARRGYDEDASLRRFGEQLEGGAS